MFKLEIRTGGSAFMDADAYNEYGIECLDPTAYEVRRILKDVEKDLRWGHTSGKVMDINGNCVGKWSYD
jgi:hypothetical protein